jgi:hypothetical protein
VEPDPVVQSSSFEKENAPIRLGRETVRQDASCGARADDDVVVVSLQSHHPLMSPAVGPTPPSAQRMDSWLIGQFADSPGGLEVSRVILGSMPRPPVRSSP